MKHLARVFVLLTTMLLAGCGTADDDRQLLIEIRDAEHCEVGGTPMLCSEVVPYMRDVLGAGPTTEVRFRAPKGIPYQTVGSLMMEMEKAKVAKSKVGFIRLDPPDGAQDSP
jgi:biopolymer transport protein ExbD